MRWDNASDSAFGLYGKIDLGERVDQAWFRKMGWIHRPIRAVGWAITALAFLLIAWVFMVVDRNSHSASDTLIGVLPWAWIFLATLNWIASKTSSI